MEFNLGEADNYRVPDGGLIHVDVVGTTYVPTASLVIEVLSPGDESRLKFGHYAAHGVGEVLLADPHTRSVETLRAHRRRLRAPRAEPAPRCERGDIVDAIRWPAAD